LAAPACPPCPEGARQRSDGSTSARHGITRLILDVLPARTAVISFYRRLGYTETEPFETESPVPMTYMERAVTRSDILSGP
jgi:hypothetical protein